VNEHKALLSGFDYTSKLICQFNVIEKLYMSRKDVVLANADDAVQFATEFEASMLDLYSGVLEFQARALCHLSRHPIRQRFKETFEISSWKEKIADIRDLETMCRNFTSVIDSAKLHSGLEKQERGLLEVRENTTEILDSLRRYQNPQTAHIRDEFLKTLYTSRYTDHKDRNQEKVQGTCQWFTNHPLFQGWRDNPSSCFLWVSADPGCGKSVLAKHLVDHEIQRSDKRIICYFFFKDDHMEQKSAVNALCAMLRQLFLQNDKLLRKSILDDSRRDPGLTKSFSSLWDLLLKVASDSEAEEIVCVLDALDECEEVERSQLARALNRFYRRENTKSALKFLVTSRPYAHIQREFQSLKNHAPEIHLSGEDGVEIEKISNEINLVIQARVEEMGDRLQLDDHERVSLRNQLLLFPNRTYLWVTLTFDVIENSISYTNKKVQEIINTLPTTVDEAYENILARCPDQPIAKKLLHIVVSAVRPLTLKEMRVALAVGPTDRRYKDLDLESETRFPAVVRNICGLFVTIIDSKIYLLHQTAKEFLVKKAGDTWTSQPERSLSTNYGTVEHRPHSNIAFPCWKHSLVPTESNNILNDICIAYLLFEDFESCPERHLNEYTQAHDFLEYATKNWAEHFRKASREKQLATLRSAIEVCRLGSRRFDMWFSVYQKSPDWDSSDLWSWNEAQFNDLLLGSYLGLELRVKDLIRTGQGLRDRGSFFQRSALTLAAEGGHERVVNLLLDAGAGGQLFDIKNKSYQPLEKAATNGHVQVVEILLAQEKSFLDTACPSKSTALWWAAGNGHEGVVRLLLASGADANGDSPDKSPLLPAAENGHLEIVRLLLKQKGIDPMWQSAAHNSTVLTLAATRGDDQLVKILLCVEGVNPDRRNREGCSPLFLAAGEGHIEIVKLLIATNAVQLDAKDSIKHQTPLLASLIAGHDAISKLLVDSGAQDLDCGDPISGGRTALSIAAERGNETLFNLLLATGKVNPNSKSSYNRTPLSYASESGATGIVSRLLNAEGADPNLADTNYGRTPLSWAAANGHLEVVQLLLQSAAVDVKSCDLVHGRTPRSWALAYNHLKVAHIIREEEIRRSPEDALEMMAPECAYDDVPHPKLPWRVPTLVLSEYGDDGVVQPKSLPELDLAASEDADDYEAIYDDDVVQSMMPSPVIDSSESEDSDDDVAYSKLPWRVPPVVVTEH
jgi:ankyrin repeat protein